MIVKMCMKYKFLSVSEKQTHRQAGEEAKKKYFALSMAATTAPQRVIDKNVKLTHAVVATATITRTITH